MHIGKAVCAILVLGGLLTAPAAAEEVVLAPTMDVYVDSANPGTNFGGGADLLLGKGTFWDLGYFRAYLMFDVASLAGQTVESAVVRMYQYDTGPAAGGLPCDAHRVTGAWSEGSITWNSKPAHDAGVLDSENVGDSFYEGWIEWDITPLVQGWADGSLTNQGLVLKHYFENPAGASRYGIFRSVESGMDAPELVVQVTAPVPVETSTWGSVKSLFR